MLFEDSGIALFRQGACVVQGTKEPMHLPIISSKAEFCNNSYHSGALDMQNGAM